MKTYSTKGEIRKINKNNDADTMYDNTSLPVTHKACVSHFQLLLQGENITIASVKHMSRQRAFGKCGMIRLYWILVSTN